jgi:hypothetical protein
MIGPGILEPIRVLVLGDVKGRIACQPLGTLERPRLVVQDNADQ